MEMKRKSVSELCEVALKLTNELLKALALTKRWECLKLLRLRSMQRLLLTVNFQ